MPVDTLFYIDFILFDTVFYIDFIHLCHDKTVQWLNPNNAFEAIEFYLLIL